MTSKTAVFTISSLNYGAYVRTLMESVKAVHTEWDRHVLLVDRCDDTAKIGGELFTSSLVEDLPLPKKNEFLFRYDILELNTAVKPYMFAQLRRQGYERIIYIDPDILLIDRLDDVERLLDEGATAIVTPHLTAPTDDECHPTELDIMRAGAYNLGFLALGAGAVADAFISWWQEKLEYGALVDMECGLFTDQKWIDLAPGLFGGFAILRDPGYNAAYWNLKQRPVTRENGVWMAGGSPLRFFHFSGFDAQHPQAFSKHQNRLTLNSIGEARALALDYAKLILGHGHEQLKKLPYAFGTFDNGVAIPTAIRSLYREDSKLRHLAGNNPFASGDLFTQNESEGIAIILRALWLKQHHIQRAFPDPLSSDRIHYHRWFIEVGAKDSRLSDAFIQPVKNSLHAWLAMEANVAARNEATVVTIWGRALLRLHKLATGGTISSARIMQYRQISNPVQFMDFGLRQFRNTRLAKKLGLSVRDGDKVNSMRSGVVKSISIRYDKNSSKRHAIPTSASQDIGVNVIGYARSEHGVGQSLRQFTSALDANNIPCAIIDFNLNNPSRIEDDSVASRIRTRPEFDINVFHVNADQMPEVERHLPKMLDSNYNIGFWHWELPEMNHEHLAGFNRLDEVWVPTSFVQDAVAKKSPVPVVRMPHAIHFNVSPFAHRSQFGLPEDKFLFLMIYDFSSYQQRKNPEAALAAFELAFGNETTNAALVIKTQNAQCHENEFQLLRSKIAGRNNIIWINETLTRQQVYDLQFVCDALISLHRSEGFGLAPAEAMFLGKPVIATNWSGNTDFMRAQNSLLVNYRLVTIEKDIGVYKAGQTWAEPDVAHAAKLMRQIVDDDELRLSISAEAKRTMEEEFSPEVIGRRIRERLIFVRHNLMSDLSQRAA